MFSEGTKPFQLHPMAWSICSESVRFHPWVTFSYWVGRTIASGAKPSLMGEVGGGDGWSAGGKKLLVFCS